MGSADASKNGPRVVLVGLSAGSLVVEARVIGFSSHDAALELSARATDANKTDGTTPFLDPAKYGPCAFRSLFSSRAKAKNNSTNAFRNDGLENSRVIDFFKCSLKFGSPDLDSEVPAQGNHAAQNAQNHII